MPFTESSIVILYFDAEGCFLGAEERETGREAISTADQPSWIGDLHRDAGLAAAPIVVHRFEAAEYGISIGDRPVVATATHLTTWDTSEFSTPVCVV